MRLIALCLLCFFAWSSANAGPSPGVEERLQALLKDPRAMEESIRAGNGAAFFCANCHGEDGNSKYPEVPNLAGQNPAYLLEQIRKFGSGERRDDFMQGLIKVLGEQDRLNIALYYARQPVRPHGEADAARLASGRNWYFKVCRRCHGEEGRGSEKIARIAGQQPEYLIRSLTRYRDRSGERMNPDMAANTSMLKDQDIRAVAEYVSRIR